ncbi:hypothetical protein Cni_G29276 [Canna indica]|uniref:Myb/SANT-like domain-containing protein n=1 Tax=Canna indica TaxID=4628 RepID=A0AAQ3L8U9_9LILI|nr:hypothetical protein Cni_G29276 [Canna indica]
MSKRKNAGENSRKEGREAWTPTMDDMLVDAFLYQHNMGNRVNGTFTTFAYDNIMKELNSKLNKNLSKEHIKNRWKSLKANFAKCYDFFKNGLSGFAWDRNTNMWSAEPEVWEKLVEAHPQAKEWMTKSVPNYDKMVILYGRDRATGEHAETAKEMKKRQSSMTEEVFDDTIEGIDRLVAEKEVTIDPFENMVEENAEFLEQEVHSRTHVSPHSGNCSKTKKAKKWKEDKEVIVIADAIDSVAEAIRDGNVAIREGNEVLKDAYQCLPVKEDEVYSLLEKIRIAPQSITQAYIYLLKHPDMLRGVLGCPPKKQKAVVMEMVFGPSSSDH